MLDFSVLPDKKKEYTGLDFSVLPDKPVEASTPPVSLPPTPSFMPNIEQAQEPGNAMNLVIGQPLPLPKNPETIAPTYQPITPLPKKLYFGVGSGVAGMIGGVGGAARAVGAEDVGKTLNLLAETMQEKYNIPDQDLTYNIASGLGSMATFMIPGVATETAIGGLVKIAPLIAKVAGASTMAVLESAVEGGSVFNRAKEKGWDDGKARRSAVATFIGNLPINYVTDKIAYFGGNRAKVLRTTFAEGGQEAYQQVLSNMMAEDPESDGVVMSALVGGITGGVAGGVQSGVQKLSEPKLPENLKRPPYVVPPTPQVAPQQTIAPVTVPQAPEAVKPPVPAPIQPITHPAGKVTGIDQKTGYPLIDREQPSEATTTPQEAPTIAPVATEAPKPAEIPIEQPKPVETPKPLDFSQLPDKPEPVQPKFTKRQENKILTRLNQYDEAELGTIATEQPEFKYLIDQIIQDRSKAEQPEPSGNKDLYSELTGSIGKIAKRYQKIEDYSYIPKELFANTNQEGGRTPDQYAQSLADKGYIPQTALPVDMQNFFEHMTPQFRAKKEVGKQLNIFGQEEPIVPPKPIGTPEQPSLFEEQAKPKFEVPKTNAPKTTQTPLETEALKYKTPEEFARNIEYHGTDADVNKIRQDGFRIGAGQKGVSTTQDAVEAKDYGKNVLPVLIKKDAEMAGIPGKDFITGTGSFNPKDIIILPDGTTKSQLTEIWNKAHAQKQTEIKFRKTEISPEARTENFKRWFSGSKVVDEQGNPKRLYSGHSNTEAYGTKYNPKLGEAGGFYSTENPEIASGYTNKMWGNRGTFEHGSEYRIADKSGKLTKKLWQVELTPEQKQKIDKLKTKQNKYGDNEYPIAEMDRWVENTKNYTEQARRMFYRGGSHDLQSIHDFYENNGNTISGYDTDKINEKGYPESYRQSDFEDLLDAIGLKWTSKKLSKPGVMPVYLNIKNPIDTSKPFPPEVLNDLKQTFKRARNPDNTADLGNMWSKEYNIKQWIDDIEKGNDYWPTQIPQKAIPVIKRHGYDGIKDTGGKGGGEKHAVWIAFDPEQIKSATGNTGEFNPKNPDIRFRPDRPKLANGQEGKLTPEEEQKVTDFAKSVFHDDEISVTFAKRIIDGDGKIAEAWGSYDPRQDKIFIDKNQTFKTAIDTTLHEGVHRTLSVLKSYTTNEEYQELMQEAAKKEPNKPEEKVAEDFVKYWNTRQGFFGKIKTIFDAIIRRLRQIFGKRSAVADFYNSIRTGERFKAQETKAPTYERTTEPAYRIIPKSSKEKSGLFKEVRILVRTWKEMTGEVTPLDKISDYSTNDITTLRNELEQKVNNIRAEQTGEKKAEANKLKGQIFQIKAKHNIPNTDMREVFFDTTHKYSLKAMTVKELQDIKTAMIEEGAVNETIKQLRLSRRKIRLDDAVKMHERLQNEYEKAMESGDKELATEKKAAADTIYQSLTAYKPIGEAPIPKTLMEAAKRVSDATFKAGIQVVEDMGPVGKEIAADLRLKAQESARDSGTAINKIVRAGIEKLSEQDAFDIYDMLEGEKPFDNNNLLLKEIDGIRKDLAGKAQKEGIVTRSADGDLYYFNPLDNYAPHKTPNWRELDKKGEVYDRIANFMVHRGTSDTVEQAKEYIDHYVEFMRDNKGADSRFIQDLVDMGKFKTYTQAKNVMDRILSRQMGGIPVGNLERSREFENFPIYDPDIKTVIPEWIERNYNRLKEVEIFGRNGYKLYDKLDQLAQEGKDWNLAVEIVNGALGRTSRNISDSRALGIVKDFYMMGAMSFNSTIQQPTTFANTSAIAGFAKAIKNIQTAFTKEGVDFALRSGAINWGTRSELAKMVDVEPGKRSGEYLRRIGMIGLDKFMRVHAANTGKDMANHLFAKLQDNKGDVQALAQLQEIIPKLDLNVALRNGSLSESEQLAAGYNFSAMTQHIASPENLPRIWRGNPWMETALLLKSFSFMQARFAYRNLFTLKPIAIEQGKLPQETLDAIFKNAKSMDDITNKTERTGIKPEYVRNLRRLVRFMLINGVIGEGLNYILSLINKRDYDPLWGLVSMGTFGMATDMIASTQYGKASFTDAMIGGGGPVVGMTGEAGYNAYKAAEGIATGKPERIKPLARTALRLGTFFVPMPLQLPYAFVRKGGEYLLKPPLKETPKLTPAQQAAKERIRIAKERMENNRR